MLRLSTALVATVVFACASFAQEWTQMADMPGPGRHHPVNFVLDGKGYVVTGSISGAASSDDFYRYDPVDNSWEVLPDFPGPDRGYAYGGAYGGKGYLGFGRGGTFLADLWEYDPVSENWTELASCPGPARTHPAFVITDDGKIYVGMGNSTINYRDWWVYDIAADTWTSRALLPGAARHHPFYFNIGTIPYVGFGHGSSIFRDFYRFNPSMNTWTQMADFPEQGRVAGQQFSYGGKGYIISGDNESHGHFPTGEFWEYDPAGDSWTELTPHPGSSRWAPGTFVIGSTLYLMCGLSSVQLENDLWTYEFLDPTDVDDAGANASLSFGVFPNPVRGRQVRILNSSAAFDVETVWLMSASGRRVAELSASGDVVGIPWDIPSGQYFISLAARNGERQARAITVIR